MYDQIYFFSQGVSIASTARVIWATFWLLQWWKTPGIHILTYNTFIILKTENMNIKKKHVKTLNNLHTLPQADVAEVVLGLDLAASSSSSSAKPHVQFLQAFLFLLGPVPQSAVNKMEGKALK